MTRLARVTFLALVLALAQAPGPVRAEPDPAPPPSDLIEFASEDYTLVEIDGREFMLHRLSSISNTAPDLAALKSELSYTDRWAVQQLQNYWVGKPPQNPDSVKLDFQFMAKTRRALFQEDMQRGWMLAVPITNHNVVYKFLNEIPKPTDTPTIKLPGVTAELDLLVPVDGGTALVVAIGSGTDLRLAGVNEGAPNLGKSDVFSYAAIRFELQNRLQLFWQFGVSNLIEGAADWGSTQEAVLGMLVQF